ncbi:DUF2232 domain-containing protein [Acidithiobacillus ferrivorans]|uniref:DUF2232 domain-containing protein n=2 Tax=Acidithiobacillus ferrivorans TaxID=160808 RepID=A0A7T5BGJ4_9PROT|nr:DUF2232 domain-containing protein [Acidithiobacillus ferrivorans]MBN6740359.1 DUF2232 domain-containing protein [Acidithiobacillus sp. MC6.1]QQD72401.1 DUF2232 domain-containing protein [Acidithiobacillus ferrivorans]
MAAQTEGGVLRWFLSGRWQAGISIAVLFSAAGLVPFLAAPLLLNCVALVALVTLQAGRKESFEVLLIAGVAAALFTLNPWYGVAFALVAWLPGRLLGEGLQWDVQWGGVVWVVIGLSLLALALSLWVIPRGVGPAFWQTQMEHLLAPARKELSTTQRQVLGDMTRLMPGILAAGMALLWTLAALMASRWRERFQGVLVPQRVFRDWVLPDQLIWLLVATLLGISLLHGNALWPVQNLAILVGGLYLLQGLSFMHLWFASRGWPLFVLTAFYIGLILLSQLLLVIAVLGIVDRVFHLRQRLASSRS